MVRVERRGRVELITLDRPERRNAVDHATLLALLDAQAAIAHAAPGEIRAIVLTGAAPAFCAGADLTGVERGRFADDLRRVLHGFGALPVPVIAAIDGPALGAGAQLAVASDLRIATPDSVVGVPAARLGLSVDLWTIRRLGREFGDPVARAMLIAAETYRADALHRLGGIHRLGDLDAALAWAEEIAALAPLTIVAHKLGLETPVGADDTEFAAAFERAWSSADQAEGRAAFLQKRMPNFTGS